jgi:hypothetical protein
MAQPAHPDPPTPGITLHVRPDVATRLQAAAQDRGLSITWMANKLLAEGLDELRPADEFRLTRDPGETS